MDDLNDLYFFSLVVQHKGFSAAARVSGIEKTRLSRRVASLEQRLGMRLLQRSTRTLILTEAGEQFYLHCVAAVESAREAYDSVEALKSEPTGAVRMSCPVVLAQSYLAPILPDYMASHPKVAVYIEATDRQVNLFEERLDLALQANVAPDQNADLVALPLGSASRILVASPALLERTGRPRHPSDLTRLPSMSRISDLRQERAYWTLSQEDSGEVVAIELAAQLISSDMRVQFEAAVHGIGVALLPEPIVSAALREKLLERVLPSWSAAHNHIRLVYRSPRGMLPSVRSLIDYLASHLPGEILKRGV